MKYLILFLFCLPPLHAAEWKKFLRRSVSGSVGHASIIGSDYRGYTHLRGRFDHSLFEGTRVVAEGLFEYTDIQFDQQLSRPEQAEPGQARERKFKYQKNNFRAEELYLSQEVGELMTLSYGVQKVVWGQFEPYSPTNLVFPFNLSTTDVEFNKVKGTLPQEAGIITLYPTYNTTLSLYAFPKITYDNVIKNRFDNPGTYTDDEGNRQERLVELPAGSDELQTGARLMYYPSWGTIGLSYHKGYNTTQPFSNSFIELDPNRDSDDDYIEREKIGLAKRETVGLELAVPWRSFILKGEISSYSSHENIRFNGILQDTNSRLEGLEKDYFDAIKNDNNFNLYVPVRSNIMAVGVTGNLSRWYLNLVVFFLENQYEEKYQNLVDLEKRIDQLSGNSDEDESRSWFPGGVVSYYLNSNKLSEIGLAAGIISNGSGGALFYKKTTDKFVYGAALQAIEYFSDNNITESSGDEYERKNQFSTGALLSLTYKF